MLKRTTYAKLKVILSVTVWLSIYSYTNLFAQDRFQEIEQKLNELASTTVSGLNGKVEISVNNVSIQEFLRGLAKVNNVNLNLDPTLDIKVINNFSNETFANVLLFLAREYNLDLSFVGSIISVSPYKQAIPLVKHFSKEIAISFDKTAGSLTMDLKGDSLPLVTKMITQLSNINVVWAPYLKEKIVTGYIQNMPFDLALSTFAFANDLAINKAEEGLYLIEKKIDLPQLSNRKTGAIRKGSETPYYDPSQLGKILLDVKETLDGEKLLTLDADEVNIKDIIKVVSQQLDIEYFLFANLNGSVTTHIVARSYEEFLSHLFKGTDYTFKKQNDLYLIGERKQEGLRVTKVVRLKYRSVENIVNFIPGNIKQGVEIKEFSELNAIVLSGSYPQIQEIEAFIESIDEVVPLVLIEVILLDIRKSKSTKVGLIAGLGDSTVSTQGTILPGFDFAFSSASINNFLSNITAGTPINLGKVTPNFYLGLSAIDNQDNANVRSVPKISTLNGHQASFSVGSQRFYSINQQSLIGTQNPVVQTTQQWNNVEANMSISIKPLVAENDQVTLEIDVQISDFIGDPPANAPPPSTNSQFQSLIRIKSDEMVILGGIERIEKSQSGTGIPLLSRIPILKWFFGSRSKSKSTTISVVFIKPTIIY